MTSNLTLYRLLVKLGATEAEAETAASVDVSALATKQDLQLALAEFGQTLAWKIIGAMVSLTGIYALIVAWLTRGRP
jgi:hypothetical protein